MKKQPVDSLIELVENHIECWKQFNHYLQLARAKKFDADDEAQFLELKSVLAQQLELVLASVQCRFPTRDRVHELLADAPSLRFLTNSGEDVLRVAESRWHRIYIGWQSILGQLKVKQQEEAEDATNWFTFRRTARKAG